MYVNVMQSYSLCRHDIILYGHFRQHVNWDPVVFVHTEYVAMVHNQQPVCSYIQSLGKFPLLS